MPTDAKTGESLDRFVGQTFGERYSVVRRLGQGGMGAVYEGLHRVIGKRVAIKVLHQEFAAQADELQRFVNEARAAAMLQHPHIIDAADIGTTPDGEPYIVLEYLEGQDLQTLLDAVGPLPIARTARIVRQVCSALSVAHAKGIVHRDLKPQNVFLLHRGENEDFVKVLDFGISKFRTNPAGRITPADVPLGTPAYMAPEQIIDSHRTDARTDIYAAGVLLYRMLSGLLPHDAQSFAALALLVMAGHPKSMRAIRPALPEALEQLVLRTMAVDPNDRFQTMSELSTALEPWERHAAHETSITKVIGKAPPVNLLVSEVPTRGTRPPAVKDPPPTVLPARGAPASSAKEPPEARVGSRAAPPETLARAPTAPSPPGSVTAARRSCPRCSEIIGREVECPHCGEEVADLRLGEVLAERYRVDRLLGAGGMGRVYLGTHLALQEHVAIKFLLSEWTARGEFRARFRREATTLAKLRHPGIVTVHDYGEHAGELYMVMEFVKGRALRDVVAEGEVLPVPRALALIDLVLEVIEYAHAQGVVHRDLKPDNIMMLELGERVERLKVLDFGLALATDTAPAERLTATLAVQGTPIYMSPEQCRGRDVGPPTDVYALGVMLFEWLCGALPFDAASFPELLAQHMFKEAPRLTDHGARPNVPASVEALVRATLAKAPEQRPSALEFRERIAQIRRGDDSVSVAERGARERTAAAQMSRDERAGVRTQGPAAAASPAAMPGMNARVLLWGISGARSTELSTNLAVNGCDATLCADASLPNPLSEGPPVKAVVVQWTAEAPQRVQSIRARTDLAKVAIVVLDAPDVDAAPALIRAGASDVVYLGAAADAVCKQTLKLMRRVK